MTLWGRDKNKMMEVAVPKRHDKSKQMWREFSNIYLGEACREPGVILWNKVLMEKEYISGHVLLDTQISSVQYGDKDFFVNHLFSDVLSMQRSILLSVGRKWQVYIKDQIENCDKLAKEIGNFARKIFLASGGDDGDKEKTSAVVANAKEQLYNRVDVPFRAWLRSIDTEDFEHEEQKKTEWSNKAKKLAYAYMEELVSEAGETAYVGKTVIINNKGKEMKKHYSVPRALNEFQIAINKIYPTMKGGD